MDAPEPHQRLAGYVATLGRGPGRSRALSREEACDAFAIALSGAADPHQLGALLMLLRYRGEDPEEITGLVQATRAAIGAYEGPRPDLDWPSYGAGRTRGAPWFLLAALALAAAGTRILMHGTNEFTDGITVERALAALEMTPATSLADAAGRLEHARFAYLPAAALSPPLAHILGLRRLLGLRSPANTVARLLDPADAPAAVDGVFHPPYIALHLAVAARLDRPRLLVLKGGGGEAERPPAKPVAVHIHDASSGPAELLLPPLTDAAGPRDTDTAARLVAVWHGADDPIPVATVVGTIAMALLAMHPALDPAAADREAKRLWEGRKETPRHPA